jgi:hypothetical protein
LIAPAPGSAQQAVSILLSPTPVDIDNGSDCTFPSNCIEITTNADGAFIDLGNSGDLTAGQRAFAPGPSTLTPRSIFSTSALGHRRLLAWRQQGLLR